MTPVCRKAQPEDFTALEQLLELYQYELSDIWRQDLDANDRYGYDLARHRDGKRFHTYLASLAGQPIRLMETNTSHRGTLMPYCATQRAPRDGEVPFIR